MKATAEAVRFVAAGAVNTGATLVLYWVLLLITPYQAAYTVSYVAGIVFSYWLNTRFVFRVAANPRTAAAFPIVYVVGYLLGIGALHVAVEWLDWPRAGAILLSIAVTVPATFMLSRAILTRSRRKRPVDGESADPNPDVTLSTPSKPRPTSTSGGRR
jgi:putative flippase GtrA